MKVLFVITSVPFAKDYTTITNLVKTLSLRGHEVHIFFSGNGVYYLIRPDARILSEYCTKISFCSHSTHQRGITAFPDWAQSSSTYNLSKSLGEYERVIVFN
jgi:sulfur relay (sulfurtransferase) complex TusBCD TusD component (DsrE family)